MEYHAIRSDATRAHERAGPPPVVVQCPPADAIRLRRRDLRRQLGLVA
ncbi:hypothetical protein U4E84_05725 [Halorubrum sp. AD140]|nr:hypothetical protein [Halorubrum sp. AD140]MDZ5810842.1 hypothetical protein [Halorubrum sp. AD140]